MAPPEHDPALEYCLIVDIDGTLARMHDRGHFDWDKVGQDDIHHDIKQLVNQIDIGNFGRRVHMILCSGCDEVCRPQTEAWLVKHGVYYTELHMRPEGNLEKDTILKERIYRDHIQGRYNVLYALDDRNQVVDMWCNLSLRCLQVADGDF